MTTKDFVAARPFTIELARVPENPNYKDSAESINYHFVISYQGRTISGYFSTGCGWVEKRVGSEWKGASNVTWSHKHNDFIVKEGNKGYLASQLQRSFLKDYRIKQPTAFDILECYKMDSDAESCSFEDWADNLGYNKDSISDKRTYELCQAEAKALRKLLGKEYTEFMATND